ncbi:MAG: IS4 family transposase [Cyclobacteriaceae bacterium]|jgi:hypothetical protein
MRRPLHLEYSDVQAVINSGPQAVNWVRQELSGVDLGDKRLDRRLIETTENLARSPISPINEACGTWASTKASYRLFNNPKAKPAEILKPHTNETVKRMAACDGPVLVIQDTVFISYGTHPNTRGLGPIGKRNCSTDRGLIMHNALAFTTSGVALGIVSQQIWARKEVPDETKLEKNERIKRTSLDEKESSKWLLALRKTVECSAPGVKIVTVADRESDFFEFIAEAEELSALYLIRAKNDRKLDSDDSCDTLSEALAAAPVIGTREVHIPGNGKKPARTAIVEIRLAEVNIMPPQKHAKVKDATQEPITVNAVSATEAAPPPGNEALSWVLLTNLAVKSFDDAAEKIDWYAKRWGIETWHKVLKSGCKVEDCLLETADRLKRFLSLFSIIAFRLMHITYLARVSPDAQSTDVFSEEEVEALHIRVKKTRPPKDKVPTLREAVQMIGSLGGHLGRKADGDAGITVMWRGLMRLYEDVEMLRAHKVVLGNDYAS